MEFNILEIILNSVVFGFGIIFVLQFVVYYFFKVGKVYCYVIFEKYGSILMVFICCKDSYMMNLMCSFLKIIEDYYYINML